jgi:hypothetical protein
MTLLDLINFLYEQLNRIVSLNTYELSQEDTYLLNSFQGTAQILYKVSEENIDKEIYLIADDLIYAAGHVNVALFKAECGLKDAKDKIELYSKKIKEASEYPLA